MPGRADIRGAKVLWMGCACPGGQMSEEQMSEGQKSYMWMGDRCVGADIRGAKVLSLCIAARSCDNVNE